jgi:hypothetical protein
MKKILSIAIIISLVSGCKPEPEGELGDPLSKIEGLKGSWEITSFKQQDPNNPVKEERDLSEFYIVDGQTPMKITFNADATYSVVPGPGKNPFGPEGTWHFDNPDFPTTLTLMSILDTIDITLNSITRPSDAAMTLAVENKCTDIDGVSTLTSIHKFYFNRLNQ